MEFGLFEVILFAITSLALGWSGRSYVVNKALVATNNDLADKYETQLRSNRPKVLTEGAQQVERVEILPQDDGLKEINKALLDESDELRERVARLEAALSEAAESLKEAESEHETLLELDAARNELFDELEAEIARVKQEKVKLAQSVSSGDLSAELDETRKERDTLNESYSILWDEVEGLRERLKSAPVDRTEEVTALRLESAGLRERLEEALSGRKDEVKDISAALSEARKDITEWKSSAARARNAAEELSAEVENLKAQLVFKDQKITDVESDRENTESKYREMQVKLAHARSDSNKLEAKIGALTRQAEKAEAALSDAVYKASKAEHALDGSPKIKAAEKYAKELAGELNATASQNMELKKEVADLRNQVAKKSKEVEDAKTIIDDELFDKRSQELDQKLRRAKAIAASANKGRKVRP